MADNCVAHCPQHYFGRVQAVQLPPNPRQNFSKSGLHTQGICLPCHDSCMTCQGSMASDCFQCASGFERKGDVCEKKMIWDLLDPDVMKHLAWAIILCIAAILLFSVIFGIMQARDRGRLCWRVKANYVPDWSKGHYDGVTPSYAMQDSDIDTETPIRFNIQTIFPGRVVCQKKQMLPGAAGQNV